MREGDTNINYFHAVVKSKRADLTIGTIVDSIGKIISSLAGIHEAMIAYFKFLLMSATHTLVDDLIDLIPELVLDEDKDADASLHY